MLCVLLGRSVAAVKPNSSRSLLSSILQSTTDSEKKQVRSRCWLNRNIFCVHKLLYLPLKALKASKKGGQIGTYIKKFDGLLGDDIALEDEKRLFFFFFFFYCLTAFGDSVSSWLWQARLLPLASMIHVTLLSHTFEMMLKDGDVGIGSIYSICWTQIFRRKRYFSHQI